jgi:capsular polysaccharide biosynthesis protein
VSNYLPVDEPVGGPGSEPQPSQRYLGGFVSLHYVVKAISRRKRVWITLAVVGLLVGMSLHVVVPRKFAAESTLYLDHNPNDDPARDMATDVALLQSEVVAQLVINKLHLQTTAQKLTGQYAGVATTDNILEVTFEAPTPSEAVSRANALDTEFLQFRSQLFQRQNTAVVNTLAAQVTTVENEANSDPSQRTADQDQANNLNATILSDDQITTSVIRDSSVVGGATAITHSAVKVFLADGASGLIGGLVLGVGLVALMAIASDRIRLRHEVAAAVGAPVELSVSKFGRMRVMRKRRLRRRLSNPGRPVELMTRHLRTVVHSGTQPKRLAIIPIDSLEPSALSVAILAGRLAVFEGKRVMVVDLSPDRVLGELLGVSEHETRIMFVKGAWVPMLVAVPPGDEPVEMSTIEPPASDSDADGNPDTAWTSPQVVLVLSTLDLGLGASHLASVADEAIIIVTAGRSNAVEIRSTADVIRAAGLTVRGAILVGSDNNDDSTGIMPNGRHAGDSPDGGDELVESPPFASASERH